MPRSMANGKSSRFLTLTSICIVVAALYLASAVLIPLALGILFSFLLTPMSNRLERLGIRRVFAGAMVVSLALVVVASIGWLISAQVSNLAEEIPQYRTQIVDRIHSIEGHFRGGPIANATRTVAEVAQEVVANPPTSGTAQRPMAVTIATAPSAGILGALSDVLAVLAPLAQFIVVVVVAAFILVQRDDLRDRLLRLMGEGQLTTTTQALDEAAHRVSQYLVSQTIINGLYAIVVGIALYFIGVPNAGLWGLMCGLLRFIPYAGIWIGAAFPILLSLILPAGTLPWFFRPILTGGLFLGMELLVANIFEPWVYGSKTGVSSAAIIIAAIFWTWIWGAAGLVLSTPLTVCLAVAGKYIPQLWFLHVLLGDEPVLAPHERFYQRLLADDADQARALLDELMPHRRMDEIYDTILIRALQMAERDSFHGSLEPSRLSSIQLTIQEMVEDLRQQDLENPLSPVPYQLPRDVKVTVVILSAKDRDDDIAGLMLAHILERRGYTVIPFSSDMLASEMVESVSRAQPDVACISALPPGAVSHSRYLCKRLKGAFPTLPMLIGLWGVSVDLEAARRRIGCSQATQMAITLSSAVETLRQMVQGILLKNESAEPQATAPAPL